MNERICATALYYLDGENVTPSHLSFRIQTSADNVQEEFRDVGQVCPYHMPGLNNIISEEIGC